jgi:SAM-dependent methyltransferase
MSAGLRSNATSLRAIRADQRLLPNLINAGIERSRARLSCCQNVLLAIWFALGFRMHPMPGYAVDLHLRFVSDRLGYIIKPGASILDFGCGHGRAVKALLDCGYDAYGVDISNHWNVFAPELNSISERLLMLACPDYRLPFPDHTFDFCFSDQVFEHIVDYATAFSEIVRVLKPGAISAHRFPGPNRLMEGHVELPFPWLCYSHSYLLMWALIGGRRRGQENFSWRQTVEQNTYLMRHNNYPTKKKLRAIAEQNGVTIQFFEKEEFCFRGGGRYQPVLDFANRIGLRSAALSVLGPLLSRYMVLRSATYPPS